MGKRFFAVVVAVLTFFTAFASQEVVFETNAPMIVGVGEPFRVEFTLNAKPDDKSFEAPSFEGFSVLAGPSVSQGSSIQIVNGSMTRSVSYTITYVLQAPKAGQLTIGVAKIAVDGKSYSTQKTPIEVRQDNDNQGSTASQSNQRQEHQSLEQRASSKREAREFLRNGAVTINGDKITDEAHVVSKDDAIEVLPTPGGPTRQII